VRAPPAAALALALAAACLTGCPGTVTVLSWNAFNLFDAVDDGTEYREYDPGLGRWSAALYERRLDALAAVIRRSCPGGPDVVALQELENRRVLDDLCGRLSGYPHRVAPEGRGGVRCGVASRYPILGAATLEVGEWGGEPLRPVLEVELDCKGAPLRLLVVHWKSRVEGEGLTQPARDAAAAVVSRRLSRLLASVPAADVVVAGDFNQNADELLEGVGAPGRAVLAAAPAPALAGARGGRVALYDPWLSLQPSQRGSSGYRGAWQTPDHLLLSPGLFDHRGLAYRPGSFRVVRHSFMLDPRTGFPLRDRDLLWRASDHLPILVELERAGD
jgi:endonuclease/exonuclease/phosphatase family metal-dependent hydrolase